jgi:GntR family transcriptional regulator, transcriptional repressor for pyruvate dehydrogenase complex
MVRPPTTDTLKDALSPINRQNLKDGIVAQIKDLIFSNKIKVGEKLPSERDLAQRLKVGRAAVREALKSLEQSGLVEIRTGGAGGAYAVSDLHIPFFYAVLDLMNAGNVAPGHFWEFGKIIECAGARLAALNATAAQIEELGALNRELMESAHDPEKARIKGSEFHLAVAEASANPLIALTLHSLTNMFNILSSDAVIPPELMTEVGKRHEELIAAIAARDADLAEAVMATDAGNHEKEVRRGSATSTVLSRFK